MASEDSLTTLLRLTESFLSGNGFQKTAVQLQKEAKKRGLSLTDEKPQAALPALDSIYTHWQATHILNESEGSESDASSVLSSDSEEEDSEDESSDSDDSSSEDESEEEAAMKVDAKVVQGIKRKRGAEVTSDSSSDETSSDDSASSADDSSDSSSASDSSDSDSDSDSSDSDAESDSESVAETSKAAVKAAEDSDDSSDDSEEDASSDSDSDSDSDSSSDSDSDSSDDDEPKETATTTPMDTSRGGSTSSATLSGDLAPPAKLKRKHADTDESSADQSSPSEVEVSSKKVKKTNEPFSRIPKDQHVDPKLASNKFVPYDYAQRAHEKLIVTKGKGFTKEKNKGKRGSYKGGKIDFTPKGIKFDD